MTIKARYIGNNAWLKGKTAILKNIDYMPGRCEAQFDDMSLPSHITHGWRSYETKDWEIISITSDVVLKPSAPPAFNFPKAKPQPKEWAPDTLNPELMSKKLREW